MMNQYTMQSTLEVAKQATREIEKFLKSLPQTESVLNVEDDKYFQKKDIDLIWSYTLNNKRYIKKVEIKGDRYSHTGNYFIETVSNQTKNTPGCFMYTECDLLFYYFVDSKELNVIPMPNARNWFVANKKRFAERQLLTKFTNNQIAYSSKGSLVPKAILNKEVKGVKTIILNESTKSTA